MKLAEMTWPEVASLDRDQVLVLAPIAASEQHSRHLPTFTDTILCGGIADRVEERLPKKVLCLPVFWWGASDHHLPFGATLTAEVDTHVAVLRELLTPMLESGFRRLMILNGHGGNIDTLHVALRGLQPRYPDRLLSGASYWEIAGKELAELAQGPKREMGHACEFETSMMLYLRPELVRRQEIQNDPETTPEALRGLYLAQDFGQRTQRGAVGYPEFASAESGKRMIDAVVARVVTVCESLLELPIRKGRIRRDV
ncbi:MAG: creatininase family protein [Planctomycetota bacterium]